MTQDNGTKASKYADLGFKPKHVKDFREFVSILAEHGDCVEVDKPVDWNLEVGAVVRRVIETGAPAPLFTNVVNSQPGFRVLGAPGGISAQRGKELIRVAVAIGLPAEACGGDIVEALSYGGELEPIPPRVVDSAPFQANVRTGDDVDLLAFPSPLIHDGDGGRFINSFGTIVVEHPESDWVNWSVARIMLVDKNTMSGLMNPIQHLGQMYLAWKALGKDMPFALSIGQDPVVTYFAGMPLHDNVSEAGAIGAYLREPIDVVKAQHVDLYVPASSEIVLEGYVSFEETAEEGPMSEYPGYLLPAARSAKPVYHVTAMSYRDDAILPVSAAGYPPEENHTVWGIAVAAMVLSDLRSNGFPVTQAYLPFMGANHLLVVTVPKNWKELSGGKSRHDFSREIVEFVLTTKAGEICPRILVVEDDVDPTNDGEVLWAIVTRVHPTDDILVINNEIAVNLIIYLSDGEKGTSKSAKVVLCGLYRDEFSDETRPVKADFTHNFPPELQQKVLDNWTSYYGLPEISQPHARCR